jgi:hypothetical protein
MFFQNLLMFFPKSLDDFPKSLGDFSANYAIDDEDIAPGRASRGLGKGLILKPQSGAAASGNRGRACRDFDAGAGEGIPVPHEGWGHCYCGVRPSQLGVLTKALP